MPPTTALEDVARTILGSERTPPAYATTVMISAPATDASTSVSSASDPRKNVMSSSLGLNVMDATPAAVRFVRSAVLHGLSVPQSERAPPG
jgi:hypothetical protein